MLVAMLLPFSIAQMLDDPPRCSEITRRAFSLPTNSVTRVAMYRWLAPWKP
jgi:hypothetical protein